MQIFYWEIEKLVGDEGRWFSTMKIEESFTTDPEEDKESGTLGF